MRTSRFLFISMLAGIAVQAVQRVQLSEFHALSIDTTEWNAFETRLLGNRDFLFEHRRIPSLRGLARTEYQDLQQGKTSDDYLKNLCSQRKGHVNTERKGLRLCELPQAAPNVMQFLAVASVKTNRVAIDSLTFALPKTFETQARKRVEALVESWGPRHE